MRELKVNKEHYEDILISMVYSLETKKRSAEIGLIKQLMKMEYHGMINRSEARKMFKIELKMDYEAIDKAIQRLRNKKHISIVGSTIYLNPMYKAIKECEGMFLITPK